MTDTAEHSVAEKPPENQVRDEEGRLRDEFVERVAAAIRAGDAERVRTLAGDLHEADMGALIEALDAEDRTRLIELLGDDFDFSALTEVDDNVRDEILEDIPNEEIAEGVRELDSDDAVAILEDLDPEDRAEVLEALPLIERTALRRSLDYPENSAGRLMQTRLIAVPAFWDVGRTIDYMRDADAEALPKSSLRCSWSIPATGFSARSSSTGSPARSGRCSSRRSCGPTGAA